MLLHLAMSSIMLYTNAATFHILRDIVGDVAGCLLFSMVIWVSLPSSAARVKWLALCVWFCVLLCSPPSTPSHSLGSDLGVWVSR